jgi:hypothetical protein
MKKIEIQMLLYTLTKKFIEVQINILNAFDIILFYKVVWWFDGQHIVCETNETTVQSALTNICLEYIYIHYTYG